MTYAVMNVVKCEQLELTLSAKHSTQSIDHPYWTAYKPATTSRLVPTQQTSPPFHPCNISVHVAFVHSMICQYSIQSTCTVECPVSQTACLSSEQNTHEVIIIDYY